MELQGNMEIMIHTYGLILCITSFAKRVNTSLFIVVVLLHCLIVMCNVLRISLHFFPCATMASNV